MIYDILIFMGKDIITFTHGNSCVFLARKGHVARHDTCSDSEPYSNMQYIPGNTKHLYNICTMLDQRRRRWTDVVQMLYKCFVFAGMDVYDGPQYIRSVYRCTPCHQVVILFENFHFYI